jgi:endoglucanase
MKIRSAITVIILLVVCAAVSGAKTESKSDTETSPAIRLNSLGYLPDADKPATIILPCSDFAVKKADGGKTVYSGKVSGPFYQQEFNQTVWIADFTKLNTPGKYYLDVPGVGRSYEFEIGDKVYNFAYYTSMRAFYLWRCGTAVEGTHEGIRYSYPACHMQDGWQDYIGAKDSKRDGTGGWHDAGDYGKYTVNAGMTTGTLFLAWEMFEDRLKTIRLDIPDTAPGYPDFLKELKWETDWLLKMRYPDGSGKVSHKLTSLNFEGFIMPQDDLNKRYFSDWGSEATANFVGIMAIAARVFKPYDAKYAKECLDAATRSYEFLQKNPTEKQADITAFHTGSYATQDYDDRIWAAAELWETTGEAKYLKDFEARAAACRNKIDEKWNWDKIKNIGMFNYLLSKRQGRDKAIVQAIRQDLIATANVIVFNAKADVYARSMGDHYYWGSNGAIASQTMILQVANTVSPNPEYKQTVLSSIGHLFGRNYYGRSYVTGLGHLPPLLIHDRRSGADGIEQPWPGYIVGGGHSATDWKDIQDSYQTNEIAINWNATLVFALAGLTNTPSR